LIAVVLLVALAGYSQPGLPPPGGLPGGMPPSVASAPAKEPVNYLIRVEWTDPKGGSQFLEVLTAEGRFDLNTIQKTSVKIKNNDIPTTLKFSGTLNALNDAKGRLQLYLGRTVPYVTGTGSAGATSYSQMSVGLDSAFIVKFAKPLIVQNDENGQISILVKRVED